MTIRNYSGIGSTTNTPPAGTCWVDGRPVPEERWGLIPALCSDTCRDQWAFTCGLDVATHRAADDGWQPVEQGAAEPPAPAAITVVSKPGSWLHGLVRRAL